MTRGYGFGKSTSSVPRWQRRRRTTGQELEFFTLPSISDSHGQVRLFGGPGRRSVRRLTLDRLIKPSSDLH